MGFRENAEGAARILAALPPHTAVRLGLTVSDAKSKRRLRLRASRHSLDDVNQNGLRR